MVKIISLTKVTSLVNSGQAITLNGLKHKTIADSHWLLLIFHTHILWLSQLWGGREDIFATKYVYEKLAKARILHDNCDFFRIGGKRGGGTLPPSATRGLKYRGFDPELLVMTCRKF